jgi:hypothetical protein
MLAWAAIDFLAGIWHVISQIGCWILWAIESAFNLLVEGIAAAVEAAVGLLPDFPELPDWSGYVDNDVIGMASWFVDLGFMLTWIGTLGGLFILTYAVLTLFRWAKAVKD